MIVTDLDYSEKISETHSIVGGQSYGGGGGGGNYYYIDKGKYNCYSYYNEKWGGTYYECYQDGKAPKSRTQNGTLLP